MKIHSLNIVKNKMKNADYLKMKIIHSFMNYYPKHEDPFTQNHFGLIKGQGIRAQKSEKVLSKKAEKFFKF